MLELTILSQTVPAMTPSASMPMGQMHNGAAGSKDMQVSMMMGMDGMQKMPMSGDTDKDFATMMKMHHQQAVNMSEMGAGKRQIAGDENLGQDDHPAMKAVFALAQRHFSCT